jgi:hydrogenase-4 component F
VTLGAALVWILPLVPTAVGVAMLALRDRRLLAALDVIGSAAVLVLGVALARDVHAAGPQAAGPLRADALAVPFLLLVGLLALCTSIYTVGWMRRELELGSMQLHSLRTYYALVQAFIATMLVTVLADNLGVLWIAMEGTTITSAILVGFHGHRHGLEAAWKYIIVTTIGISFGLFGTVLVYAAVAHAGEAGDAMSFAHVSEVASRLDPDVAPILRIGFIFALVGYGTKAGLAPVHMWLPDAHSQAPTPVSVLLSGALIKCALLGILRFHVITRGACGPGFSGELLALFGLLSVMVATPFIVVQRDFKRLLGYSSVEHVGIIALGLGFGGRLGTYAALLHVINHGVTKALVFFVAGDAIPRYGSRDMHAIRGFLRAAPWAGTLLMLGAFSLAGTPPFSIFVSELLVVRAGIAGAHFAYVALFLVAVVVIFAGLLHHAGGMALGEPPAAATRGEAASPVAAILVLAAVMLLLGLWIPGIVDDFLTDAVEQIGV